MGSHELEVEASGVIFRNPFPGHRVINAFYPMVVAQDDGELLCVLRRGGALYSPDGMLHLFRLGKSCDTWAHQGPVFDRMRDARQYNYSDGHLTRLHDGSLLLRVARYDMTDPERFVINAATQGLAALQTCFLRSYDAGRTWSEPVVADVKEHFAPGVEPAPLGGVVELPDGSWFQLFDTWKDYENAGPFDVNSYGLFSADGGRTWRDKVAVAVGTAEERSYSHGIAAPMRDGRVFVSYWTATQDLQTSFDLHTVISTDASARQWSRPLPTGVPGQTSCVADAGNGCMWMIYSHREHTEQPGIKVVLSTDAGRTWRRDEPLVVWDAYGKESLGVARSNTYPSSHDAIAYGAPRVVALDGGSAIASFWCSQGGDTHCRWCRIRIR